MLDNNDKFYDSIRNISAKDFLAFGMHAVAYLKEIEVEGRIAVSICAADGTPMMVEHTLDSAVAYARDNDLEAVRVN